MAQVSSELLTSPSRTASATVNDEIAFTVDFYRCGKCNMEFDLFEDFIFHKIIVEKSTLVLWDSEKISGIQIPRFSESGVNFYVTQEEYNNVELLHTGKSDLYINHENATTCNKTTACTEDILSTCIKKATLEQNLLIEKQSKELENVWLKSNALEKSHLSSPSKQSQQLNSYSKKQKTPETKSSNAIEISQSEEHPVQSSYVQKKPECHLCGNTYRDITTLRTHVATVHSDKRPYQCNYSNCCSSFKTKASLQRHVRQHTGERPFVCNTCGKTFRESGTLSRHLKARVPCLKKGDHDLPHYGQSIRLPPRDTEEAEVISADEGLHEGRTPPPKTLQIIITHVPDSADETVVETQVKKSVENQQEIRNEQPIVDLQGDVSAHPDFAQLLEAATRVRAEPTVLESPSPMNEETQEVQASLDPLSVKRSLSEQMQEQCLHCAGCDEQFNQPHMLSHHLQSHLAECIYRCTRCYHVCKDKTSLINHCRAAHNRTMTSNFIENDESKLIQEIVLQLLMLHDILDEQEKDTTEAENPQRRFNGSFRCHICFKKFQGKGYFGLHMGTHTGEKPYKCNFCDLTFVCKDFLSKHLFTHSKERSFKCRKCNKLFKRASHIREHLRVHSDEKLYFCKLCNRGFKWRGALKSHEVTHNHAPQFTCELCGRRFRARSSLMRHARRHLTSRSLDTLAIGTIHAVVLPSRQTSTDTGQTLLY